MKLKSALICIILMVLLAGCNSTSNRSIYSDGSGGQLERKMEYKSLGIVTDKETGCQYILAIDAGITPRVDGNGNIMGCKK